MQALRGPRVAVARARPPPSANRPPPAILARTEIGGEIGQDLQPLAARASPASSPDAAPDGPSTAHHHNHNHHPNHKHHNHGRQHNHDTPTPEHGAAALTTPTPTTPAQPPPTTTPAQPPPHPPPPARPTRPELLAAVRRFVETAFRAVREGPDAAAPDLAAQLHPAVTLAADPVRRSREARGVGALLSELGRLHAEYGPGAAHRPILFGASAGDEGEGGEGEGGPPPPRPSPSSPSSPPSSLRAAGLGSPAAPPPPQRPRGYALLEARYQDVNALPGHPATFRVSTVVFLVGVELGPGLPSQPRQQQPQQPPRENGGGAAGGGPAAVGGGSGGPANVITRVWIRRQLTYEDRDELLVDPVGVYPAAFPHALLSLLHEGGDGGGGGGGGGGGEQEEERRRREAEERAEAAGLAMARAAREWWSAWGPPHPRARHGRGARGDRRRHDDKNGSSAVEGEEGEEEGGRPVEGAAPPPASRLPLALLSDDFDFFDAYGLWPTMRQSRAPPQAPAPSTGRLSEGTTRGVPALAADDAAAPRRPAQPLCLHHAALRGPESVARYASALSSRYRVHEWRVVDAAPADGAAACFTHWRARLSPLPRRENAGAAAVAPRPSSSSPAPPPPPPLPLPFVVEGFEVDLFDPPPPPGFPPAPPRMRGVYLFRGPLLGGERAVFLAHQREQAARREAAVLSARRAAREAALGDAAERLDAYQRWIAGSLRKWGDRVYRAGAAGAAVLFWDEDGGGAPAPGPAAGPLPDEAGAGAGAPQGPAAGPLPDEAAGRERERGRGRGREQEELEDPPLGPPGV